MLHWPSMAFLGAVLIAASICDVRTRQVPVWLTVVGIVAGVIIASLRGLSGLEQSAVGLVLGLLVPLPLVVRGGLGAADALLLGAVGAAAGWQLVLWTAWWASLAGAAMAFIQWRRGRRTFAYVPAIAVGFALAMLA